MFSGFVCALSGVAGIHAAEQDVAQLPPPAAVTIDFDRDIRPVLDRSCMRCHGPERPSSGFRLDTRDAALRGGLNNTDDIVPGDSARSRLIHYVAGIDEEIEMPPAGKGEPLTPETVGLLRAWIDQGAKWGVDTSSTPSFSMTPSLRWIEVSGDARKFREIEGITDGGGVGVEHFSFTRPAGPDRLISGEGRFLFPDRDFRLRLEARRRDLGFVRGGFENWRRYYDDSGGYSPAVNPPEFDLTRDLHLDIGRLWIDVGLTLPRWPEIVFGYEYRFRDGDKAMLDWGNAFGRNIYPAKKSIDEKTHILKLDITHETGGWMIEERARVEFHDLENRGVEPGIFSPVPAADRFVRTHEQIDHVRGMNVFAVEKQFRDWWFASGGYYYSRLSGGYSLDQITTDTASALAPGTFWRADQITLRRESHVLSAASVFTPIDNASVSVGLQNEWTRQEGFGNASLDFGDINVPGLFFPVPVMVRSDLDQAKTSETINARYSGIPFTVLFADAALHQDRIGQFEQQAGANPQAFLRDTDFSNDRCDIRAGFNVSPRPRFNFSAQYRRLISDSDYDDDLDTTTNYSAFITGRTIESDQVQAKLSIRANRWLKTTLTYQLSATDFTTRTDPLGAGISPGGRIHAGDSDAQTYGMGATITPRTGLYFSGSFTYSTTRLTTADNGSAAVVPYDGDSFTAQANATYALNASTELTGGFAFSTADYGQRNFADGVPLGINYTRRSITAGFTRRLGRELTVNLRYAYYDYDEPGSRGGNDYTAHGVFATIAVFWP